MADFQRKEIMPGVFLTCVSTTKFKTGVLSASLLAPLDQKTAAANAMLPQVLCRGSARYPDIARLATRLEELYGASMDAFVRKKGEIQSFGLYFRFLDNAFVPDGTDVLGAVAQLAGEVLLDPATSGGRLRQDYVESERANLMDRIRAQMNDKRSYAAQRLAETMCAGERYGISSLGSLLGAEKISAGKLTAHYKKVLAESRLELFYCGTAALEQVELCLLSALRSLPRALPAAELGTEVLVRPPRKDVQYVTEEMDVVQGKLCVGFRLGESMLAPNYVALQIFNAVFGGCLTSKLFVNVRERLSLCYYASSGIEKHKGILSVQSGIASENYQQALDEILAQLEACRQGEITDTELQDAKAAMITALNTMQDSQGQMEDFYLGQALEGLSCSPAELAALCEEATKAQVQQVAKSVELDTVYFLKESEKGGGENAI